MNSDYVKLIGARLARTSEPTVAERLPEGRIKFLTQGEPEAVNPQTQGDAA